MFFSDIVDSPITLVGVLITGIGSLAGVVTFLYRQNISANNALTTKLEAMNQRIEKELEECKRDRDKIWEQIKNLQCKDKPQDIF